MKRGFIKGEALRLLRTNSSKTLFEESVTNFKTHLLEKGNAENLIQTTLSESSPPTKTKTKTGIKPSDKNKNKKKENLALCNAISPILVNSWHFITQQPLLNDVFKETPLIPYKRGHSLKDILVRAKL